MAKTLNRKRNLLKKDEHKSGNGMRNFICQYMLATIICSLTVYYYLFDIMQLLKTVSTERKISVPLQRNISTMVLESKEATIDNRHLIPKQIHSGDVKIFIIDDFLSKSESDGLSSAHINVIKRLEKHTPIFCFAGVESFQKYLNEAAISIKISMNDFTVGTFCINETLSNMIQNRLKFSFSTSFYPGESKFSYELDRRLKMISNLQVLDGGKFQITSYPIGVGYKSHTDCSSNADLKDRYVTALIYLQNVREGGETIFTDLGIKVRPKQGRLLMWNNMDSSGKCLLTSIHKAEQVFLGRKYILQRWFYFERFETLGIRVKEPDLPLRNQFQPRVSCDYFNEGSCRWYDEWGYDHLTDYEPFL